jgi:hypothetical protein
MQAYNKNIDKSQHNHEYMDISIFNNDSVLGTPSKLQYTDTRNIKYLQCPSNYYVSIVRFQLQTARPAVPVFVPHIQLGQSDVNLTVYKLYLDSGGTLYNQTIEYIADVNYGNTPKAPISIQDMSTGYYNVYTYQSWYHSCLLYTTDAADD